MDEGEPKNEILPEGFMENSGMAPSKSKKPVKAASFNGWRVLNTFIEGLFQLINSNKIYPVFGLIILALAGLVVWRLSASDLADIIKLLLVEVVVGKGGLIALIILTNLGWPYLLRQQQKIYKTEIDRLAAVRSELLHSDGKIGTHRSTHDNRGDAYLVPAVPVHQK